MEDYIDHKNAFKKMSKEELEIFISLLENATRSDLIELMLTTDNIQEHDLAIEYLKKSDIALNIT